MIACPQCGLRFDPGKTGSNFCGTCLTAQTDITLGVTKEAVVHFCRFCHRYLRPPWIKCERESKELLALCLKKIHGLSKLKIVEAGFVWTECHSKRLKVRLTVQKELDKGQLLEQTFVTEFVESFTQCEECKKEFTPHVWGALVQLRQRAHHKKTFYFV
jgi:nonsense-mediated mRNA decay protein 3